MEFLKKIYLTYISYTYHSPFSSNARSADVSDETSVELVVKLFNLAVNSISDKLRIFASMLILSFM